MIALRNLIWMQGIFAACSISFLLSSAWRQSTLGEPLSAAPVVPSLLMFAVYSACLLLPRLGKLTLYRIAMAFAVLAFGGGGVVGNLALYFQSGTENYASFEIWLLAVAINSFGTLFNLIALFGWFEHGPSDESG